MSSAATKTNEVAQQHSMIGNVEQDAAASFKRNSHPDAQWFDGAGLGLFMHFGISSVCGECDLSWGMMLGDKNRKRDIESYGLFNMSRPLTPKNYWAMAKDFKAEKFDSEKILSAARKAGVKYAVLTSKHHDGFALWPSKYGDFNISNFQPGRDIIKEYVEGCRKAGIKVGLYYSPPDWHFNREFMSFNYGGGDLIAGSAGRQPTLDMDHKPFTLSRTPEEVAAQKEKYYELIRGQAEELLSNYGKIDIFWFDGSANNTISAARIRELQPSVLINNRGLGYGDFKTPECKFPEKEKVKGWWWEYCHVGYDGGWGYFNHDGYKPAGWVLAEFVKARSWGGNFLPNYAPDSHGEMPPVFYKRMEQIKAWMDIHSESVIGTEPGPWPEKSSVPTTVKGNVWYIHFDYLNDGLAELNGVEKPKSVKQLRTGEDVPFEFEGGKMKILLPAPMRTTLVDVVKVTF